MAFPETYKSWGGIISRHKNVVYPEKREGFTLPQGPWLGYGNGKSYGDSCFPADGTLVDMRRLNRIISFDPGSGILICEAGALLGDIIKYIAPLGWFPPVLPGAQHVTVGGALANDIHGKNHHQAGTFGCHVRSFTLLRSDRDMSLCSAAENSELFHTTIGGMGLTGLITTVELQMMKVPSTDIMQEALPLNTLTDFFRLAAESDETHPYSVAWIDSLATGNALGRGVFLRGEHAPQNNQIMIQKKNSWLRVPFTPPLSLINRPSLKIFNTLYRAKTLSKQGPQRVGYSSFFFPLDAVAYWNRIYGPKGLRQHQCVLPLAMAESTIRTMIEQTHRAKHGSFLTVLKLFGDRPSPGLLSFPRAGATLTLDFPYRGAATDALLDALDALVMQAGGAINPYKDAHMSAKTFKKSFPRFNEYKQFIDPMVASGFSSRVGLTHQSREAISV
jgi:FAD/FMN-containing dehydrogenase